MARQASENLDSLRRHLKRLVEDEQDRPSGPGAEKRRHERHLFMVKADIKYVKSFGQHGSRPNEFTVFTKDLSRSGLSFLHEHEMYVGEIIQVEVTVETTTRALLVRVTRCRRAGLKVFDIAGEFITAEEAAQAQDAGDSAPKTGKKIATPAKPSGEEPTETEDDPQGETTADGAGESAEAETETPEGAGDDADESDDRREKTEAKA